MTLFVIFILFHLLLASTNSLLHGILGIPQLANTDARKPQKPLQQQSTPKIVQTLFTTTSNEVSTSEVNLTPSLRSLVGFAVPTLGIWLLQPILSIIDTSVIGVNPRTTVAELAALGPGIAWIDSTAYLFQFMGIATTNLYATALSKSETTREGDAVISHALFTSFVMGIVLLLIQNIFAKAVITMLCGASVSSIPHAVNYAKIRSFAAPFALPTIVGQAGFLAAKDAVTPFTAVLIGALVNFLGDILLVSFFNMGVNGAAIATALSQIAGAIYLLLVVIFNISKDPLPNSNQQTHNSTKFSFNSKVITLICKMKRRFYIPTISQSLRFLQFCGPLFIILLIKTFLWTYTTYACASAGTIHLAAHQITINLFLFFVIFGDVTSQLAQTFIPTYLTEYPKTESELHHKNQSSTNTFKQGTLYLTNIKKQEAVKTLVNRISKLGIIAGSINFIVCLILERTNYQFFTKSKEIAQTMRQASLIMGFATLPHCLMCGFEGAMIAWRDVQFHTLTYGILGTLFLIAQTFVKKTRKGISSVWIITMLFQWLRLVVFSIRTYSLHSTRLERSVKVE